jgi:hypothetical protein
MPGTGKTKLLKLLFIEWIGGVVGGWSSSSVSQSVSRASKERGDLCGWVACDTRAFCGCWWDLKSERLRRFERLANHGTEVWFAVACVRVPRVDLESATLLSPTFILCLEFSSSSYIL